LTSIGELVEIVNETYDERAFLRVWIHCQDPNHILEILLLDFEDKLVVCSVAVEWIYCPTPPEDPPYPSTEESGIEGQSLRQTNGLQNPKIL
jgi:hypothetical protein